MPIDKSVYVISSSMNKQISKIIVEVLQILGIPLIDLIRFYSVPIIQTKRSVKKKVCLLQERMSLQHLSALMNPVT